MKRPARPKPKRRSKYTDEFKAGAVRLIAEGRSPASIAADLDVHSSSVDNWVDRAAVAAGSGDVGKVSTDERAELTATAGRMRDEGSAAACLDERCRDAR